MSTCRIPKERSRHRDTQLSHPIRSLPLGHICVCVCVCKCMYVCKRLVPHMYVCKRLVPLLVSVSMYT